MEHYLSFSLMSFGCYWVGSLLSKEKSTYEAVVLLCICLLKQQGMFLVILKIRYLFMEANK